MKIKSLFLLLFLLFFMPVFAGLPSSDKIKLLKSKIDKELNKYFRIQSSVGKCLEVIKEQRNVNGGKVQSWDCGTGVNQSWKLVGAQLKLPGGKCLQPAGDPKVLGTKLEVSSCNDSAIQKWSYVKGQLLTSAKTCVEIRFSDTKKNAGIIQIAACKGIDIPYQQWKPL